MKERVMSAVRAEAAAPVRSVAPAGGARSSAMWGTALAAAAAFAFALISVIQNFSLQSHLAEAQRATTALQAQVAAERRTVQRDDRMLADLTAGDAKRYAVAYGSVVTHGSHAYLALTSLPPLPRGKVYQAWTLARGAKTMEPSVTFAPSANGVALVPMPEDASHLAAIALSVEPDGGSKAPTAKPTFVQPLG